MKNLGAQDSDFTIRINDRRIIAALYKQFDLTDEQALAVSRAVDKKEKTPVQGFKEMLFHVFQKDEAVDAFIDVIESNKKLIETLGEDNPLIKNLATLIDGLADLGIENVIFDPTIMRGLDYYTGIVFEIFDTSEENKRALFGGGRYDDLLSIFGNDKVLAVGFGAGDVTIRDFLETHNLMPKFESRTELYLGVLDDAFAAAQTCADALRKQGVSVAIDYTGKSAGDQLKKALADGIAHFAAIGSKETESNQITIKNLATRQEQTFRLDDAAGIARALLAR
jgi:histidyl-tRNA synthetase